MKKNYGYTLIEVLIATALIAIMVLGIAEITRELFKQSNQTIARGESEEFADALSHWLHTTIGCASTFQGKLLTPEATPLTIQGFEGYTPQGSSSVTTPTSLYAGVNLSPQLQIKALTYREKAGVAGTIHYNGQDLVQKIIQVSVQLQTTTMSQPHDIREKIIELPAAVDGSNNIQFCAVELDQIQVCMAIGARWDPTQGQCVQVDSCVVQGRFARARSNPPDQCCYHYSDPWANQYTGTDSCPPGSTEQMIGEKYYGDTRTYSCGKKCTANIQDWEDFYVCLKCP